jgi:hypothetical protein
MKTMKRKRKSATSSVAINLSPKEMAVLREVADLAGESIETVAGVIICLGIYGHIRKGTIKARK